MASVFSVDLEHIRALVVDELEPHAQSTKLSTKTGFPVGVKKSSSETCSFQLRDCVSLQGRKCHHLRPYFSHCAHGTDHCSISGSSSSSSEITGAHVKVFVAIKSPVQQIRTSDDNRGLTNKDFAATPFPSSQLPNPPFSQPYVFLVQSLSPASDTLQGEGCSQEDFLKSPARWNTIHHLPRKCGCQARMMADDEEVHEEGRVARIDWCMTLELLRKIRDTRTRQDVKVCEKGDKSLVRNHYHLDQQEGNPHCAPGIIVPPRLNEASTLAVGSNGGIRPSCHICPSTALDSMDICRRIAI
ncbi:hypothetical protein IW261DRAFT_1627546 [Armillaria novae-zelandiae]|uniref:Uncharacterized protein n=1 Tax=Armillaria novae-zelandiae TaxID=153914 RepID=A0AA39P885_9AGAR|nr:hypothetical protein IW261DRAFT_1627546 [Armillaria novae-zelandiae]